MIKLELLEPCQNCKDFEPIKTNEFDTFYEGGCCYYATVTCGNTEKCRALIQYLQKYLQKEVKKNGE